MLLSLFSLPPLLLIRERHDATWLLLSGRPRLRQLLRYGVADVTRY